MHVTVGGSVPRVIRSGDQRSELVGIQSHRALLSALSTSVSVCTGTKREQEGERWPSSTSSSLCPVYCSRHFYGLRFIDPLNVGYNVLTTDFLYTQAVVPAWWKCMQLLRNTTDTTTGWKDPPNPSAFIWLNSSYSQIIFPKDGRTEHQSPIIQEKMVLLLLRWK